MIQRGRGLLVGLCEIRVLQELELVELVLAVVELRSCFQRSGAGASQQRSADCGDGLAEKTERLHCG